MALHGWDSVDSDRLVVGDRFASKGASTDVLAQACREGIAIRWPGPGRAEHALPRELRAVPRIPFDCPARWTSGGVERFGTARDASEAGAGFIVRADSRPELGQTVRLVFELDDTHHWLLDEQAVVTRCTPRPDGRYDVGVRLREIVM
ncbi:MAG TPA: PilZ domain-containing protein [Phycisphaerae bacterium]|nr:PilZ domain-containing protein [Phycisphaerae bacterium]HOJ73753.1 PilZ domain-containing protein [Phycisphaerae bacterium]HOM50400.1 PilZ domain-containing protein [Phycisphaerae bacterium]HOQ84188.1 PilZ domain-containing protein [Phycisphaerae bacterium]HPP27309.1 PilZ domain-containing protein [Phycisphaerae bacterium]